SRVATPALAHPDLLEQRKGGGGGIGLEVADAFRDDERPGSVDEWHDGRLVDDPVVDACPEHAGGAGVALVECECSLDLRVDRPVAEPGGGVVAEAGRLEGAAGRGEFGEVGGCRVI